MRVACGLLFFALYGACGDDDRVSPADGGGVDAADPIDSSSPDDAGTSCVDEDGCDVCGTSSFEWSWPSPTGADLTDVFALADDRAWAVGIDGTVLEWDGADWERMPSPGHDLLTGVWATSADDVWVVGRADLRWDEGGRLHRWNGTSWSSQQIARTNTPRSIWGAAPDDVWIGLSLSNVSHWDGAAFQDTRLGPGSSNVTSLYGFSTDDVWAVGEDGLVAHWNGAEWTTLDAGTEQFLFDVWGASPDDVWIVGVEGTLLHWDGSALTPSTFSTSLGLHSVMGSASDDVWAIAEDVSALHWNGATWSEVPTALDGERASIHVSPGGDVLGVGAEGLRFRRAAGSWTTLGEGPVGAVRGIWGTSSNEVWAVGSRRLTSFLGRFDGTDWTTEQLDGDLNDVWASAADDVWVVGAAGLIRRHDGSIWIEHDLTITDVYSVWGAGPDDIWVGAFNTMWRFDGSTWTEVPHPHPPDNPIDDIFGLETGQVYAASEGRVYTWNGTAWDFVASVSDITRIWGASETELFASGHEASSLEGSFRYDGDGWDTIACGRSSASVWGFSATDVWFAGPGLSVQHWDGTVLSASPSYGSVFVGYTDLWGAADGTLFAGTRGGVLMQPPL